MTLKGSRRHDKVRRVRGRLERGRPDYSPAAIDFVADQLELVAGATVLCTSEGERQSSHNPGAHGRASSDSNRSPDEAKVRRAIPRTGNPRGQRGIYSGAGRIARCGLRGPGFVDRLRETLPSTRTADGAAPSIDSGVSEGPSSGPSATPQPRTWQSCLTVLVRPATSHS